MIEAHGGILTALVVSLAWGLAFLLMWRARERVLRAVNESLRREVEGRQEAEEKLDRLLESERLASGARLRAFFEASPQAALAVTPGGEVILVNRRIEEIFGYGREELLGQNVAVLIPERFREMHGEHQGRYFAEPSLRAMIIGRCALGRRKDGTEFPVEVHLNYVQTDQGTFALAAVSDITERRRAEEAVSRINAELRRTNQELEQFTYVASHDLQEPLRMVSNYLQLLEKRLSGKLEGEDLDFLHYALAGAGRMKVLIQDLLRLSKAGTQKLELAPTPLAMAAEKAKLNLSAAIEESGAILQFGPLPTVEADAGLLVQILQNLIGNAIKFRKADVPCIVWIGAEKRDGEWVVTVKDNGIGFDPVYSGRIFKMFERLHGSDDYAGSGIGLAIVQCIVERHGGKIWVESEAGEGSRFHFSLPDQSGANLHTRLAASG